MSAPFDPSQALQAMIRLRVLDEALAADVERGVLPALHLARGEEAAVVGVAMALGAQDWLFPSPREYGASLLRGVPLTRLLHQLYGTAEDPAHGRQLPGFGGFVEARVACVAGSVGAHVPHAVGLAWAARMRGDRVAAVAVFGDGATSSGELHNGANFAGVFKAPVVLVCRNNGRAGGFPVDRQCAAPLIDKADVYGLAAESVDGHDVGAVHAAVSRALEHAYAGQGASLLEVHTAMPIDPIERALGTLGADSTPLWQAARQELESALAVVRATPPPEAHTLHGDVFARSSDAWK